MPQLDKFTFLDQSLTVLFFFLIIYVLSLYFFLPKILFVLRFRTRVFLFFKLKYTILEQKFSIKFNNSKFLSKQSFDLFYFIFNFLLTQNKELIKLVRYIILLRI